jgi:hypothetical protein
VFGYHDSKPVGPNGPDAGSAIIINVGSFTYGGGGGTTLFEDWSSAANATVIATGGMLGGNGGYIGFSQYATGGAATIGLMGNATLDLHGSYLNTITIQNLELVGGTIITNVGSSGIALAVTGQLYINSGSVLNFTFNSKGMTPGQAYTVLSAPNVTDYALSQFAGTNIGTYAPAFSFSGNNLQVTFGSATKAKAQKKTVQQRAAQQKAAQQKPRQKKGARRKTAQRKTAQQKAPLRKTTSRAGARKRSKRRR